MRARAYQIYWIFEAFNSGMKDNTWFYYDIIRKIYVFLNGRVRSVKK